MFKKKKQPVRIEAELSNDEKGRSYKKVIEIPVGYTVAKESFSNNLIIRDSEGRIKTTVYFQAGYTITLNYLY